jgi:hypothetical protein
MPDSNHILTSWKEIAAYLGKGVRTVQRWERELSLPVRRPDNGKHVVVARGDELDRWVEQLHSAAGRRCCNCKELLEQAHKEAAELREKVAQLEQEILAMSTVTGAGTPKLARNAPPRDFKAVT